MHKQLIFAALLVVACGNKPAQKPDKKTPVVTPTTTPTKKPDTIAALPASVPASTPALVSTPASTPASVPASEPSDPAADGPVIDCTKMKEEPAPSRRWLCEQAMAKSQSALFDSKGFILVTEFEEAGEREPGAIDEGHLRKRVCGAELEKKAKSLASVIRLDFSIEDPATKEEHVGCDKMSCTLTGMGEYSTNISLTFRSTPTGPVLDSWGEIEVVLVDEAEVKKREANIAKGLKDLAKSVCPP